jgi:hypothetical protein
MLKLGKLVYIMAFLGDQMGSLAHIDTVLEKHSPTDLHTWF